MKTAISYLILLRYLKPICRVFLSKTKVLKLISKTVLYLTEYNAGEVQCRGQSFIFNVKSEAHKNSSMDEGLI